MAPEHKILSMLLLRSLPEFFFFFSQLYFTGNFSGSCPLQLKNKKKLCGKRHTECHSDFFPISPASSGHFDSQKWWSFLSLLIYEIFKVSVLPLPSWPSAQQIISKWKVVKNVGINSICFFFLGVWTLRFQVPQFISDAF